MASSRITIAQAVVSALQAASNAEAFSQTFTAAMKYVPAWRLDDLAAAGSVQVTVAPMGPEKRTLRSRQATRKDFTVEIGIQKKLSAGTNPESPADQPELDGLMQLAEEIAAFLEPLGGNPTRLGTTGAAIFGEVEIDPPYLWEHLVKDRVFTSRIVATYAYV